MFYKGGLFEVTKAERMVKEIEEILEVRYATKNPAYKAGKKINPSGCVVHSIGVAQPSVDVMYGQMNRENAQWAVHFLINNKRIIQMMPLTTKPWGCGSGPKGSYNSTRVQFEICEPAGHTYKGGTMIGYDVEKNTGWFEEFWQLLIKFSVYLALKLGYGAGSICDHAEAHALGMGSGHADVGHWFPKHGKSMDALRREVGEILDAHARKEEDFDVTKDELKAVLKEVLEELNPVYNTLEDVPEYWREEAEHLMESGAVKGNGVVPLGLSESELKSAIIMKRYCDGLLRPEK